MFRKQGAGMIAKPGLECVELTLCGIIHPEFIAGCRLSISGGKRGGGGGSHSGSNKLAAVHVPTGEENGAAVIAASPVFPGAFRSGPAAPNPGNSRRIRPERPSSLRVFKGANLIWLFRRWQDNSGQRAVSHPFVMAR